MKTRILAALATLVLAAGCTGSDAEPSPETSEGAATGVGSSVSGAFTVTLGGRKMGFDYQVSDIDETKRTLVWNARVTDNGGDATVTDDVNRPGRMTSPPTRCTGCFTAEIPGSNGYPLAVVTLSSGKVVAIKYENAATQLASGPSASPGSVGAPDDRGACTLNGGQCKPGKRSECRIGGGLPFITTRGSMIFTFAKGGTCPP